MAFPSSYRIAEAIDEAWERIQIDPKGLDGQQLASTKRSIRLLLDDWNNDSVDFWKVASAQTAAVATGDQAFTPVTGCIDILDIGVVRSAYMTPMSIIARSDWFAIPDKGLAAGMANRMWLERVATQSGSGGTAYLLAETGDILLAEDGTALLAEGAVPITSGLVAHFYPKAENSTDILIYDAMMQFNDSTVLGGSPDVPPRWNEAFTAGLTWKLAEKFRPAAAKDKQILYGGPGFDWVKMNVAMPAYQRARMGDRERGDTILVYQRSRRTRR